MITEPPHQHERALQAGAKDFVRKPLDGVEVTTRVHNLLALRWLYQRLADDACNSWATRVEMLD